jgi:predicted permease
VYGAMNWWQRLWRRGEMEEQLDKELRFHLDEQVNDLKAHGQAAGDARREARLVFGGTEQIKESCRDARGTRWLEDFWQDLRYALRTLRQKPGFAAVALITLALGVGATTVMFTVINGVLLKPLAYPQPDRLLALQEKTDYSTAFGDLWAFTNPNYLDCKSQVHSAMMAGIRFIFGTVSEPGDAGHANGREVSADFFPVVGVPLFRGRPFRVDEDRAGADPVAIISYTMWQQRFGGNARALGSKLVIDGRPYTVIGIAPAGLRLDGEEADFFTPLAQDLSPRMRNREAHGLQVWARLLPGETLAHVQTELAVVGRRLAAQYPGSNKGRTFIAEPLRPSVDDVRSTLWLLLGAVSLVLLIACANVASLLLARALSRDRELAMRVALGAGRFRLVRQCLTESAVLACAGGLLGVVLATVGVRPFVTFWPGSLPRAEEVGLDWHVWLFALAASLASGLLFGLAPAMRAFSRRLGETLRAGTRSVSGGSRRLYGAFVISEIALSVVLLISAGMLGRTLLRLSLLDPGLNIHNVFSSRVGIAPATLADTARIRVAWQELLDRARRVPGVESVAMVDTVPMRDGHNQVGYWTTPAQPPDNQQPLTLANSVTPDYLKVMGLPLLRGRFFTDQDRMGNQLVVVIDTVMAQQAFAGQDAIGKHVWFGLNDEPATVVGVVGHVRYWGLAGDDQARVRAQLYYPFAQVPDSALRRWSELMSIAVRTSVPALGVVEPLRREVRGPSNDQVLYEIHTIEQLASDSLARQRFLLLLFAIFAGLALLLACIGVYGVLAYLTGRRAPEIGVRMALGATSGDVVWLVLRQSLWLIVAGVMVGVAAAIAAGRLLAGSVAGMQATDPATYSVMIAVLMSAALFASWLPARRAARVDPLSALRQE